MYNAVSVGDECFKMIFVTLNVIVKSKVCCFKSMNRDFGEGAIQVSYDG